MWPRNARRRTPHRLAFAEHMDGFVPGQRASGAPKRMEMLAGFHPPFDGAVVLFHHMVEATADAMSAGFGQKPFVL